MSAAENLIPLHFLFDEMEETIMEKEYKTGLKYAMRELSEQYRAEHQYTLEEMAEQLDISAKAYNNLKYEKNSFSASTLLTLLIHLEDEQILGFVEDVRTLRKKVWEQKKKKNNLQWIDYCMKSK